jgi:hypothetical protein
VRDGVVVGVVEAVGVWEEVAVAVSEGVGVDEASTVGVSDGVGSGVSLGVGDGVGVFSELSCSSFDSGRIKWLGLSIASAVSGVGTARRQNRKTKPASKSKRAGMFLFPQWLMFISPE